MINKKNIKQNLELFSFPRLSGTKGEKKSFDLIFKKVSKLNVKVQTQDFTYTSYFADFYPKILVFIGFNLLFLFYLNLSSIFISILYFICLIILIAQLFLAKRPESIKIGKLIKSQNISVKLNSRNSKSNNHKKPNGNILFFCHLDSKSQKISIQNRIRAAKLWIFSSILLLILVIIKNYLLIAYALILYLIGTIPLAINLLTTALLLLNSTGNRSKGAIDNASGIVCILELLNYYIKPNNKLNNFNLYFTFTGAEERGTMGIRYFYRKIKSLERLNTIIFNFDAIGTSVTLFPGKGYNKNVEILLNKFLKYSEKLGLKINSKRFYIGSHSDGYFLKKKRFQGFGIGDMNSYKYIHSIDDTVDKINPSILKELCETVIKILKDYDTNI